MAQSRQVPEGLKRDMRAVLLSKTGGTLLPEFERDFKKLMQKKLNYKSLGFNSLVEMVKSVPDVIRLEYVEDELAHKLFGIAAPNTYMSSVMKKASGVFKSGTEDKSRAHEPISEDDERDFLPNNEGLYSLCLHSNSLKRCNMSEADLKKKISMIATIDKYHVYKTLIFLRFSDKKAALRVMREFESLDVSIADSRDSKSNKTSSSGQRDKTGSSNKSNESQKWKQKSQRTCDDSSGMDFKNTMAVDLKGIKTDTKVSREHVNTINQNKKPEPPDLGETQKQEKAKHVYIGNIPQNKTDELESILNGFNYKNFRIKNSKDSKKVFAFADFFNQEDTDEFISRWNDQTWNGRNLLVRYGKAQPTNSDNESVTSQAESVGMGVGVSPKSDTKNQNIASGNLSDCDSQSSWIKANRSSSHSSIDSLGQAASPQKNFKVPLLPNPNNKPGLLGDPRFNTVGHVYNNIAIIPPLPPQNYPTFQTTSHQQHIPEVSSLSGDRSHRDRYSDGSFAMDDQPRRNRHTREVSSRDNRSHRDRHTEDMPALESALPHASSYQIDSHIERSLLSDMPPLEEVGMFSDTLDMPPLEEAIPDLERISDDNDITTIFVGNFPLGTSIDELIELFHPYEPIGFNMKSGLPTRAYIEVPSISAAELAIQELDQQEYNGRTLKVDIAYSDYLPELVEDLSITAMPEDDQSFSRRVNTYPRRM